jgi:N-acetylglutamate synthase-like GNAT family acetyltransferase
MSAALLKKQYLSTPDKTVLVACFEDGDLLGHAFATVWDYDGGMVFFLAYNFAMLILATGKVGWVTQLVVDTSVRKRYIATQLLQTLKRHPIFQGVTSVGLVSSHPAAVNALTKYCSK